MFSDITAVIIFLATVFFARSVLQSITTIKFKYTDMYSEFENFCLRIVIRLIFDRLLKSKSDARGNLVGLKEISEMSEPFYQGVVAQVTASMGVEMIRRFNMFYRKSSDNSTLILSISSIVESYSLIIVSRIRIFEIEAINNNKRAIEKDQKPDFESDYVYSKLMLSISEDLNKLTVQ